MKFEFPAFPQQPVFTDRGRGLEWAESWGYGGMTLRDYFAAKALQGLIAGCFAGNNTGFTVEGNCAAAVQYADALIAELNKEML